MFMPSILKWIHYKHAVGIGTVCTYYRGFLISIFTVSHLFPRLDLLGRNDGTEIASELVNEVCEVAFSIVYSHYLEKQAFPHAINEAKGSLLQIIEV